ncbi:MAG: hypothetical protein IJ415_04470 [Clostridia bacterium]|nr:hypothetical protein [Clostridia bacterium]
MARKERTVKNGISAVIKYVVKLLLQFVLRTIIIYKLGVEYVGLDSLYANIISMLSLAELGIGSAIAFSMYKPAAENDIEKLKSLNSLFKKVYLIIAGVVLVVGLALMPFLDFFISGEPNVDVNLQIVYLVFLLNTVVSYFGAHKRSLLFAYQRNDVENNIMTMQLIMMSIAQIVLLLIFKNYYLYVVMIPLFTLFEVIMVNIKSKKMFPEISGKAQPLDKDTKKAISKNIIATSCHKLGAVVVMSTDNLLVSKFFGLTVLGTISNYVLIYSAITSLISILINALQASVGNLIATKSEGEVYKFYKVCNFAFSLIVGFCAICMMCLYQHFMGMWVGATEYTISIWVVFALVAKFYITETRQVTNMFKNCAGLMWQDRFKPIIESVVNIVASIAFIKLFGLAGIYVGTIFSTLCAPLWVEPLVLHKHYFKCSMKNYFIKYAAYLLITLITGGLSYFVCSLLPLYGIWWFILKAIICFAIITFVYLLCYFKTSEFKDCYQSYVKPLLKKLKRAKVK